MTVRALRELAGFNQVELAAASGVTNSMISRYEKAQQIPSRRNLERIAAATKVPLITVEQVLFPAHWRTVAARWQGEGDEQEPVEVALAELMIDGIVLTLRPEVRRLIREMWSSREGPWGGEAESSRYA
ncbi:MAG TPA: helix-turn-helix domain-containing protein [Thermoanaerobaculia bacterium]